MLIFCSLLNLPQVHADETIPVWNIGIGIASRANWKLNSQNDGEGRSWITGFWSGLNAGSLDKTRRMLGSKTDVPAIWAEVAIICKKNPSMTLAEAVLEHYSRPLGKGIE